jgi:hypothetical protein
MSWSYTSSPPQAPPWRVQGLLLFIIVRKTIIEPYIDVLVFFTTDEGQHVG